MAHKDPQNKPHKDYCPARLVWGLYIHDRVRSKSSAWMEEILHH